MALRHGVFSGVITRARRWWGDLRTAAASRVLLRRLLAVPVARSPRSRSFQHVLPQVLFIRFELFRRSSRRIRVCCVLSACGLFSCCPRLGVCGSCVCSGRRPLRTLTFWITLAAGNCVCSWCCIRVIVLSTGSLMTLGSVRLPPARPRVRTHSFAPLGALLLPPLYQTAFN